MKNLYLILISIITLNACNKKKPTNLVDSVLSNLKINETECWSEFIIEQRLSKSESIVFIPKIKKYGEGKTIDAYLLIVNNKTGEIESRFTKKDCWFSDAVRLENIKIIYKPYKISEESETIGILTSYYGSSRVNPYSSKELSIFERKGEYLKRILEDFPTYTLNGENNGNSNGEYIEHKKTIKPQVNSKTEFYDLKVIDSIIKIEYEEGIKKIIEKLEKTESLEYIDGIYKNVL